MSGDWGREARSPASRSRCEETFQARHRDGDPAATRVPRVPAGRGPWTGRAPRPASVRGAVRATPQASAPRPHAPLLGERLIAGLRGAIQPGEGKPPLEVVNEELAEQAGVIWPLGKPARGPACVEFGAPHRHAQVRRAFRWVDVLGWPGTASRDMSKRRAFERTSGRFALFRRVMTMGSSRTGPHCASTLRTTFMHVRGRVRPGFAPSGYALLPRRPDGLVEPELKRSRPVLRSSSRRPARTRRTAHATGSTAAVRGSRTTDTDRHLALAPRPAARSCRQRGGDTGRRAPPRRCALLRRAPGGRIWIAPRGAASLEVDGERIERIATRRPAVLELRARR